jgi:hypothetical protein
VTEWRPFRESLRATLIRTVGIAVVAGLIISLATGRLRRWPTSTLLALWPALGGHWIDLFFLNGVRPALPDRRLIHVVARLIVWFVGGVALGYGVRLTAQLLPGHAAMTWLTWIVAGALFVAIELVAHAGLQLRGRPSFYNGLG